VFEAGEQPTAQDAAAARRMLSGETTIDEEIRNGRAELEEQFGLGR
jgi:hypothetical protein